MAKKLSVNHIEMTGFVATEPQVKEGQYGTLVRLSIGRDIPSKDPEAVPKKEYFDVVSQDAHVAHFKKGQDITVRGMMRQRSWEDKRTGQRRFQVNISANEILEGHHHRQMDMALAELAAARTDIKQLEETIKDLTKEYDKHVNGRNGSQHGKDFSQEAGFEVGR